MRGLFVKLEKMGAREKVGKVWFWSVVEIVIEAWYSVECAGRMDHSSKETICACGLWEGLK